MPVVRGLGQGHFRYGDIEDICRPSTESVSFIFAGLCVAGTSTVTHTGRVSAGKVHTAGLGVDYVGHAPSGECQCIPQLREIVGEHIVDK